jgi:rubrerythrin
MALRKCEHCGHAFWGDTEARLCPLCAVAEKAREKSVKVQAESSDQHLQPVAS